MKFISSKYYEFGLAYLIPMLVVLGAFAFQGIYPFGDTSVLIWDMNIQYAGFFGWLSDILQGSGEGSYSGAKGLGGSMVPLFAYYLSSPINLLAAFFDPAHTPQLLSWITLLKIPLAGVTCYVFLRNRYGAGLKILLLAAAYATCSYTIGYCSNIMWLDGVIMLPLVALGVQRAVSVKRYGVLFISVTLAIYFNWYTAYMVCLFSVLFFIFELLASVEFTPQQKGRYILRACVQYAVCMLLAVGASAALFLPAALGLMQGKGGGFDGDLFLSPGFPVNPFDLFSYFTIGSEVGNELSTPPLFVSGLVLVCGGAFFLDSKVNTRRRCAYALVLAVLAVSFCYFTFADIWTGFIRSSSYNHRQGFIYIFMLVMVAAEALSPLKKAGCGAQIGKGYEPSVSRNGLAGTEIKGVRGTKVEEHARIVIDENVGCVDEANNKLPGSWLTRWRSTLGGRLLLAALVLDGLILAAAFNVWFRTGDVEPSAVLLATELLLLPLFAVVVGCMFCGRLSLAARRGILILLACLFIAEQFTNAALLFEKYEASTLSYESYISKMEEVYDELDVVVDPGRVGQASFNYFGASPSVSTDESLIYGISNLTHYSSTMSETTELLSAHLGYSKPSIFGVYYNSPLLVPDALLSVGCILDDTVPASSEHLEGIELPYEGFAAYENTKALPLGYGVSKQAGVEVAWTDSPFKNQALMLGAMAGESADNLYVSQNPVPLVPVGTEAIYAKGLTWQVEVSQAGPTYAYTPLLNTAATNEGGIKSDLLVNGSLVQSVGGRFSSNVVYLGEYSKGEVLNVTLVPHDAAQVFEDERGNPITAEGIYSQSDEPNFLMIETLNMAEFDWLVSLLDVGDFSLAEIGDGLIDIDFQAAAEETLLISIPFDSGWQVWVDGRQRPVQSLFGGLMGVDVQAGQNHIELRWVPPGLYAGVALSVGSLLLAGTIGVFRRRGRLPAQQESRES